ncbi:MAG: PEP-utilizing enzyme [Actinomycetota bacterium]|jgi:phosphohistidine swiveling domain-containing protein
MSDADPLHMVSGPGVAWSRVNLSEAMPGVLTPLGWTFWANATEASARRIFWQLGVIPRSGLAPPARTDDRFIGIFFGRAAANVDWIHHKVVRMPGANPEAFELQYFGSVRPDADHRLVRTRYPIIAGKLPIAALGNPARVRRVRKEIDGWWRRSTGAAAEDPRKLFAEAYHRFTGVLTEHGMATMLTQAVYEQAAGLAGRAGHPGLETALCAGWGPTEETRLVMDLWRAARTGGGVEPLLAAHGYHGPDEGELSSHPWREDPAPLAAMLDRYRELDESASPEAAMQRRTDERRAAVATLLAALPRARQGQARLILRAVRTYVPQREVGKAAFLQTFDVARAAARAHGTQLARAGDLDDPEDIFYLTAMEVITGLPPDAKALIRQRRRRREEYRSLDIPDSWVGPAVAHPRSGRPPAGERPDGSQVVEGLGVSPGVAEGLARVILGPDGIADVEPGEILVCPTTDPSWAPAMVIAAALVIDVGGALSHGAIVARELGVPCVINTGTGTATLRTGDHVKVDGTSGRVEFTRR